MYSDSWPDWPCSRRFIEVECAKISPTMADSESRADDRSSDQKSTRPAQEDSVTLEKELMLQVARGDEKAFRELYQRFSPSLYGFALQLLRDPREAEDVLQDSFNKIWQKASYFDPDRGNPFTWAVLVVRSKAFDRMRARSRFDHAIEAASQSIRNEDDIDWTSADEPVFRERRKLIQDALSKIPTDQRQTIEMAFFLGLSHQEISDRLSAPLGTIKARIRRGLLRLRELVQEGRL